METKTEVMEQAKTKMMSTKIPKKTFFFEACVAFVPEEATKTENDKSNTITMVEEAEMETFGH